MTKLLLACCTIIMPLVGWADSPLTSTFFASAYEDVPAVARIIHVQKGTDMSLLNLDKESLAFLDNPNNSLDQKMALINAYGFGMTSNTLVYKSHLATKYKISMLSVDSLFMGSLEVLDEESASGINFTARGISHHDLLAAVYFQVMGDYFNPIVAIETIDFLIANNQSNQSIALVGCLIAGQFMMDYDWCAVAHCTDMLYDGSYTDALIRSSALGIVQEYIDLYLASCNETPADNSNAMDPTNEYFIPADGRVFSLDVFTEMPVYQKPASKQGKSKSDYVDLVMITKFEKKEMALGNWLFYNDEMHGTEFRMEVKNDGTIPSIETNMLLRILTDAEEGAKPDGFFQCVLPVLKPGEKKTIQFVVPGYWIYDPNAHFTIELDYDNNIEEKNETNNQITVFEWG